VLLLFGVFFAGPLLWLVLAPTKSDHELATDRPFAFGSRRATALHSVASTAAASFWARRSWQ